MTRTTWRSWRSTTSGSATRRPAPRCGSAEIAAEALERDPADALAYTRHGILGERPPWQIGDPDPARRRRRRRAHRLLLRRGRAARAHAPGDEPRAVRPRRAARRALAPRQAGRPLRHGRRARDRSHAVRICRFRHRGQERYGVVEGGEVRPLTAAPWAGGLPEGRPLPLAEVTLLAPVEPVQDRLRRPELPRPRARARQRGPRAAAPVPEAAHVDHRAAGGDPLPGAVERGAPRGRARRRARPGRSRARRPRRRAARCSGTPA